MKYLITESQLDKMIFKYLDNQDFIQIDKNNRIYFVNSKNDSGAVIEFGKRSTRVFIVEDLVNELSLFFSIKKSYADMIIGQWVSNKLNRNVSRTLYGPYTIPINETKETIFNYFKMIDSDGEVAGVGSVEKGSKNELMIIEKIFEMGLTPVVISKEEYDEFDDGDEIRNF